MSKKLIVIHGYAQAGKSTAVNYLVQRHNYYNASTSAVLGKISEAIVKNLCGREIDTTNKSQSVNINGHNITARALKIKVAEDCLVPFLTRQVLMLGFQEEITQGDQNVVYECFNTEECNYFLKLYDSCFTSISHIAIRRKSELKGVDKREIPNNIKTYHNDGTREQMYKFLDIIAH